MTTIAITNAHVFDGHELKEDQTVVIEDGLISSKTEGDEVIDGTGCTLLPGLIDSHVHLNDRLEHLKLAGLKGVTTVLDMGARNPADIDRMRSAENMPSVYAAYSIGCAPGSEAPARMGYSDSAVIKDAADTERFVQEQIGHGADYIKMIMEEPGINRGVSFPLDVGKALVASAHRHGKLVIAHAVGQDGFARAVDCGVDIVTHTPFYASVTPEIIAKMSANGTRAIPTIVMQERTVAAIKARVPQSPLSLETPFKSVKMMHEAGIPIMAGTDSNMDDDQTMASITFGTALQEELGYLVQAGMSPQEALQSATSLPAQQFGLYDRGQIKPGMRADLLLVTGNPLETISDIKNVKKVWIAGRQFN